MKFVPSSNTPRCTITFEVYPDMKSTGMFGRIARMGGLHVDPGHLVVPPGEATSGGKLVGDSLVPQMAVLVGTDNGAIVVLDRPPLLAVRRQYLGFYEIDFVLTIHGGVLRPILQFLLVRLDSRKQFPGSAVPSFPMWGQPGERIEEEEYGYVRKARSPVQMALNLVRVRDRLDVVFEQIAQEQLVRVELEQTGPVVGPQMDGKHSLLVVVRSLQEPRGGPPIRRVMQRLLQHLQVLGGCRLFERADGLASVGRFPLQLRQFLVDSGIVGEDAGKGDGVSGEFEVSLFPSEIPRPSKSADRCTFWAGLARWSIRRRGVARACGRALEPAEI